MGVRWIAIIPLAALAACSLLTDIPDDVTGGSHDAGTLDGATSGAIVDGGSKVDAHVDASDSGGVIPPADAGNDTGGPPPPPGKVTFDAVGPGPFGAGGNGKTSPLVWSHTTSGVYRAIFVGIIVDRNPDTSVVISAVKYDGAPFTLVGTVHSDGGNFGYTTLWALANPTAGTHDVSVEFTGAPQPILAGSISYQGVDQTKPFQNFNAASGFGDQAKVSVTSATDNMVVASIVAACDLAAPESKGWLKNITCGDGAGNGAQATVSGAPVVDFTYAVSGDHWGIIAADVKAAKP